MKELDPRTEEGPLERTLLSAWIAREDAPKDALVRLLCGSQSALNMIAALLTERGTVN